MINPITPEPLQHAIVSGRGHDGLRFHTADGRPAQLAIVDEHGQVIEAGPRVATVVWQVSRNLIANFLRGRGYLRVESGPPPAPGCTASTPESKPTHHRAARCPAGRSAGEPSAELQADLAARSERVRPAPPGVNPQGRISTV